MSKGMFCLSGIAAGTFLALSTILFFPVAGEELSDVPRRQHEVVLPQAQLHP